MESVFTQKEPVSIQRLFARIAHRYDLANSILSLGCDSLWRANVGARVKNWAPAAILDLATGSGGLALPFQDGRFDVVTMAFGLRNMVSYDAALNEARRVLRTGGHLAILDFSLPNPPL